MGDLARPAAASPGPGDLVPDPPPAARRRRRDRGRRPGPKAGWPGVVVLANVTVASLVTLRLARPDWYARLVVDPGEVAVAVVVLPAPLAARPDHRRARPHCTGAGSPSRCSARSRPGPCADLVTVRLVSGQSPKAFADRAGELAHGFGVLSCRIRTAAPGMVGPGAGPPGRPRGGHPGPAHPGRLGSAGAAGRPVRGRQPVHDPAARHPPAHRRGDRRGQGLVPVGPGAGDAPGDGGRAGPWCMRVIRS